MKFLVDNQLPPELAAVLTRTGFPAIHVRDVGLDRAKDGVIWDHAVKEAMTLITMDEDFWYLASRPGEAGTLLWLRLGNTRKQALCMALLPRMSEIADRLRAGERIIELR